MAADVAIFDPNTVGSAQRGTMRNDLPGGGRRLVMEARGIVLHDRQRAGALREGKATDGAARDGAALRQLLDSARLGCARQAPSPVSWGTAGWGSSEEAPDACFLRRFLVLIFLAMNA